MSQLVRPMNKHSTKKSQNAHTVEMQRCLLQTAAIWAALYLASVVLCRTLIASGRSMVVLLASTLLLVVALLLSRAVDVFVVIAYLPALLVLLALWIQGATDPVS